jgi:excisionase family DNA binding protein
LNTYNMSEYVTTTEAAQVWRVSLQAISARINRGNLPAIRVGRDWLIRRSDLDRYNTGRGRQ